MCQLFPLLFLLLLSLILLQLIPLLLLRRLTLVMLLQHLAPCRRMAVALAPHRRLVALTSALHILLPQKMRLVLLRQLAMLAVWLLLSLLTRLQWRQRHRWSHLRRRHHRHRHPGLMIRG